LHRVARPALMVGSVIVLAAADWPDLGSTPARTGDRPDDVALIVGIEDYAAIPDVAGAVDAARLWERYLFDVRGVPLVKPLLDEQATREGILDAAQGVAAQARPGGRVWVVFVGHGAPSASSDDGLLVGWDAQQTARSLEARGIGRRELLAALAGPQAETLVVLDACFSGALPDGGDLAPGLSAVRPVSERVGANATVLSAASAREYAGSLPGLEVPAFSYLVLGGMRGWADADGDGDVSATEVVDYAKRALFLELTDRRQTPTLETAGTDLLLARPKRPEAGPAPTRLPPASRAATPAPLEPAPSGTAVEAATVEVRLKGDVQTVWLQSHAGRFRLPAAVPPGSYAIRAVVDDVETRVGQVTITGGAAPYVLTCDARFLACNLQP
jgi:hypothetical protein